VAGRSNALSGFLDAQVTAPVIACPPASEAFGGMDILSSLRMPRGVAPLVVLEPENAALAACQDAGAHVRAATGCDRTVSSRGTTASGGSAVMSATRKIRDECGVIGVHSPDAANLAILGLHALQHRGQESAGAASFDGTIHLHKAMGLVDAVFSEVPHLPGNWAIGHNRYSTAGSSTSINAGPFIQPTSLGPVVVAHNGNIVNAAALAGWFAR